MSVTPFEAFVAPARPFSQLWRLLLGIITIVSVFILSIMVLMGVVWAMVGGPDAILWFDRMQGAVTPTSTLLLLSSFLGLSIGAFVATRLWHKRAIATLFGPRVVVIRDFVVAALTVSAVYSVALAFWWQSNDALPNLDLNLWLSFLPLALLGLLVQTGAEEVVFRGYMQQQLAARFASPLVWMLVPTILFAAVHFDPASAGDNAWIVVIAAGLFGLAAADLTARTGSLGAAWGFHFANNLLAITVLATDGTITGLSLYLTPYTADSAPTSLFVIDLVVTAAAWLACRFVLSKRKANLPAS